MAQTVVLASDHGGFSLKEALKAHVRAMGHEVLDVGTHSTEAADYPVFARAAAEAVASGKAWRGIVVDGAGIGSAMVANKVPGVRAANAWDLRTAQNAREHNDANVLTLGAGGLGEAVAKAIVQTFLSVECTVDRHKRRVAMIDALDAGGARGAAPVDPKRSPMASEHERLVDAITKVLTANPAILGAAAASPGPARGAPGFVEATCNPKASCKGKGDCCGSCSVNAAGDAVRGALGGLEGTRLCSELGMCDIQDSFAGIIDHTLLAADATTAQIDRLCEEAVKCGFMSVCVNPIYVKRAADRLKGHKPVVCTVIGFPLGATPTQIKVLEARRALRDGAAELDMVIPIGLLKSGDHRAVYEDIRALAEVAREGRAVLKVIIETALLTDEEKVAACVIAKRARAHFVKTSTGFSKGGATVEDVALMAAAVEYELEVKASGGVKSRDDLLAMVRAGATRIGASVGVKIAGCAVPGKSASGGSY